MGWIWPLLQGLGIKRTSFRRFKSIPAEGITKNGVGRVWTHSQSWYGFLHQGDGAPYYPIPRFYF